MSTASKVAPDTIRAKQARILNYIHSTYRTWHPENQMYLWATGLNEADAYMTLCNLWGFKVEW